MSSTHQLARKYMRLRIVTFLLLLTTGVLSVRAFYPQVFTGAQVQLATVKIDSTPLDRDSPGRVTSYADVLDRVRPSVVSVLSTRVVRQRQRNPLGDDNPLRRFFGLPSEQEPREQRRQGLGSGVIVTDDGYVLTNNHVIEGADELQVKLADGREFNATLIGADPQTDIAILKIESDEELPVAVLTDSDLTRVGDIVFALGNPLGIGQTVTMGIISATSRRQIGILGQGGYEDFIQTDAAINQGNSGGPLVDGEGRVIGVNTAILSGTGGNIGIGFAIPTNLISNVMESLIQTGTVQRGYLGVNLQPLTPELAEEFAVPGGKGALVADVVADSPAAQGGIKRGDVIVKVDDRPVESYSSLRLMISQTRPTTKVMVSVIREGKAEKVEVELGKLGGDMAMGGGPGNGPQSILEGIIVVPLTPELREQHDFPEELTGLVVIEVMPGSEYADSLPVGAVIVEINRNAVSDLESAKQAQQKGRNILLVNFRGTFRFVTIMIQ